MASYYVFTTPTLWRRLLPLTMGVCTCSMFCCTLLYVHSSIAITLMGKRELVVLLNLSSWCLVMVERLFLAVLWGCLRFMIVVFPDHTHLLFSLLWKLQLTLYKLDAVCTHVTSPATSHYDTCKCNFKNDWIMHQAFVCPAPWGRGYRGHSAA